ncbi:phosphotransferase family protein [Actinoplanes sp. NPDC000266]
MESITRACGPGQAPDGDDWAEEMGHGWFNVAYRIRLRDGAGVVVKIAPGSGERRDVDLGYPCSVVRDVIAASEDCLDEVSEPRFVEWDLWDSNVMIRDGRIVAIIDHERAFYGDPLIEAGFTAIDLPAFGDPAAFMRGYGHPELTATERQRRKLYTLYLILIMIIETDYRGHTDTKQYDWARERLHEVMALFRESR